MRNRILPANRNSIERYLTSWGAIYDLVNSVKEPQADLSASARNEFGRYVQCEEDQLQDALASRDYELYSDRVIHGILGVDRIEKASRSRLAR